MPSFAYRAVSRSGEMQRGEMEAANRASVLAHLNAEGAVPLSVAASRPGWASALNVSLFTRRHLSGRELADFVSRLATLVGAGVPIETAISILGGSKVAVGLSRRLRSGAPLAEAMAAEGGSFPPLVVSMVRAGELSGGLPATLARLGEHLKRSEEARQAFRSALIYPAILVAAASVSMVIVFTAVLPALRPVIESNGAALPVPVRVAFAVSDAVQGFWWAMLLVLLAASLLVRRALSTAAGRRRRDAFALRVPWLRSAVIRADFSRFARTLGTLAGGGVAMPTALEAAQRVVSNAVLAEAMAGVTVAVREGGGLADPLSACRLLPEIAVQMVRIGEATGHVDRMLLQLAEILDQDVRRDLSRALSLMVPLLTVGLGLLVAGIVASVMLAVLSINDLAQ